ncbi:Spc7 kinetochore protein-domain-containing protein [Lipomyces oligophaga]|uniref:Spc7 kinetochore protein-domain-containing protein n=1 Tax=Lipomyces oligophaga TaxID=45792 RepID=UPI0034CE330D
MSSSSNSPHRKRQSLGFFSEQENRPAVDEVTVQAKRKRAKSLDGSQDLTLLLAAKKRTLSTVPTFSSVRFHFNRWESYNSSNQVKAPRGILKPFAANDDNHTVIGVMQVALKKEESSNSKPKLRELSRRVSFAPEATLHTFDIDVLDERLASRQNLSSPQRPAPTVVFYSPSSEDQDETESDSEEIGDDEDGDGDEDVIMGVEDDSEVDMEDATDVFEHVLDYSAGVIESPTRSCARGMSQSGLFSPSNLPEETEAMEVTTAVGNIVQNNQNDDENENADETMDVTRAVGSIAQTRSGIDVEVDVDTTMDVTRAFGTIQSARVTSPNEIDDSNMTMDITCAVGVIQDASDDEDMSMQVTQAVGSIRPLQTTANELEGESTNMTMDITRAIGSIENEEEDQTVAMDLTKAVGFVDQRFVGVEDQSQEEISMDLTRAVPSAYISTPLSAKQISSSKSSTPLAQNRPNLVMTPTKSATPSSAPRSARSLQRSGCILASNTPTRLSASKPIMDSYIKIKSPPIGSPSIILRRRKSLLDQEQSENRFDGTNISLGTPDGKKLKEEINDVLFKVNTSSLQKKIQSLTPKKVLRIPNEQVRSGRKDVLKGMREEEQQLLQKIYSPLKSQAALTGSPTKKLSKRLSSIPSPDLKFSLAETPARTTNRLSTFTSDVNLLPDEKPIAVNLSKAMPYSPISLNDFLKLISIQFLEGLNTTRRTTTVIQPPATDVQLTLESMVLSKLLHCPLLELFEFSCRELRKNIEDGNENFDQLEDDLSENNPKIFRAYVGASSRDQVAMAAQFKVIKTYARLQAKRVWYEWRTKLLDGVMPSLNRNLSLIVQDSAKLTEETAKIKPSFSEIKERHDKLKAKLEQLQQRKIEMQDCDKQEVTRVRTRVQQMKIEIEKLDETNRSLKAEESRLQDEITEKQADVERLNNEILTAEEVIESNKSVDMAKVDDLKLNLEFITQLFGWKPKRYIDGVLSLELDQLVSIDLVQEENRISKVECADTDSDVVRSFFVSRIQALSTDSVYEYLNTAANIAYLSEKVMEEINWLQGRFITSVTSDADGSIIISTEVFIRPARSKVQIKYCLSVNRERKSQNVHRPTFTCFVEVKSIYGKDVKIPGYLWKRVHDCEDCIVGDRTENQNIPLGVFTGLKFEFSSK